MSELNEFEIKTRNGELCATFHSMLHNEERHSLIIGGVAVGEVQIIDFDAGFDQEAPFKTFRMVLLND